MTEEGTLCKYLRKQAGRHSYMPRGTNWKGLLNKGKEAINSFMHKDEQPGKKAPTPGYTHLKTPVTRDTLMTTPGYIPGKVPTADSPANPSPEEKIAPVLNPTPGYMSGKTPAINTKSIAEGLGKYLMPHVQTSPNTAPKSNPIVQAGTNMYNRFIGDPMKNVAQDAKRSAVPDTTERVLNGMTRPEGTLPAAEASAQQLASDVSNAKTNPARVAGSAFQNVLSAIGSGTSGWPINRKKIVDGIKRATSQPAATADQSSQDATIKALRPPNVRSRDNVQLAPGAMGNKIPPNSDWMDDKKLNADPHAWREEALKRIKGLTQR
jgi:hypothetical protein